MVTMEARTHGSLKLDEVAEQLIFARLTVRFLITDFILQLLAQDT